MNAIFVAPILFRILKTNGILGWFLMFYWMNALKNQIEIVFVRLFGPLLDMDIILRPQIRN